MIINNINTQRITPHTIPGHKLEVIQQLHSWYEEGQRLTTARLGSTHQVPALQQVGYRLGLDLRHVGEAHVIDGI